ncbi:hypothetical protein [Streptomyces sp. TR06-5]|uniref:hypothetical protein n=1 Tax=Streptomyces sp. TR06-5 TaxID=3385976 RepID=UPI00399F7143
MDEQFLSPPHTLTSTDPMVGSGPAKWEHELNRGDSVGSVAESYDNAMAEALNGTFKAD